MGPACQFHAQNNKKGGTHVGPTCHPHSSLFSLSSLSPLLSIHSLSPVGRNGRRAGRSGWPAEWGGAAADGGLGQVRGARGHRAQTAATASVAEKGGGGIGGSISSGHASFPFYAEIEPLRKKAHLLDQENKALLAKLKLDNKPSAASPSSQKRHKLRSWPTVRGCRLRSISDKYKK